MGLLKSTVSSGIKESFVQAALESDEASNVLEVMKGGGTIVDCCSTGDVAWECLGNGLIMGGVGGALLCANGLTKANDDRTTGVPVCDGGGGDEVLPCSCSDSELMEPPQCVNGAPRSRSFRCMRLQSSSKPS